MSQKHFKIGVRESGGLLEVVSCLGSGSNTYRFISMVASVCCLLYRQIRQPIEFFDSVIYLLFEVV